jgi:hypothetical protein
MKVTHIDGDEGFSANNLIILDLRFNENSSAQMLLFDHRADPL